MSIKIFQAYYRDDQLPNLDSEFTPYDNKVNPVKNIYEWYIYHQVTKIAQTENLNFWGVFSWQWKNKLKDTTAQQVIDFVNHSANDKSDVIIFNAHPWEESIFYSVWEQGEGAHPGIWDLTTKLLLLMEESPDLLLYPMDRRTYVTANYFVGNNKFWTGLLKFLDKFVKAIDLLNDEDRVQLERSAGYTQNPTLNYSGFICERLISTYLIKEFNNLKISNWVVPNSSQMTNNQIHLSALKLQAVESKDKNLMYNWFEQRGYHNTVLEQWIEKTF